MEVISEEQEEQVTITSNQSPDSCDRRDYFGQPRASSKTQVTQWYTNPLEAELSADKKRRSSRLVLTKEDLLKIQRRDHHDKGEKSAEECNSDHGRRGLKNNAPPMLQALKELGKFSQNILDSAMQQAPKSSSSKSSSVQSVRIQPTDPKFKKGFKRQYSSTSD